MRLTCIFLLFAALASGAPNPRLNGLTDVAVGETVVDEKLLNLLGGVDDTRIQDRLAQTIQLSRLPLGGGELRPDRGYLDVKVEGHKTAPRTCFYMVTVSLKRLVMVPGTGEEFMTTVESRTIYGTSTYAALALQVLVSVEVQTEDLLGQLSQTHMASSVLSQPAKASVATLSPRI